MVEEKGLKHWLVGVKCGLSAFGLERRLICLIVGDATSKALTFLASAFLARLVGDVGFGQVSWAQAIVAYSSIIADFGLAVFGTREISKFPDTFPWYAKKVTFLRFLFGILSLVTLIGISHFLLKDKQLWYVLVASAVWLIPYSLNLEWAIQGLEAVQLIGLGRFLRGVSLLGVVFLWSMFSKSVIQAALLSTVAEVVAASWSLAIALKLVRSVNNHAVGLGWLGSLRASTPLMLATIFTSVYAANFDTILIGIYHPPEHVGWYSAAYRIYLMLAVLPKLFLTLYYPRFARGYIEDTAKLHADFQRFLTLCIIYGLPVIAATFVLAPDMLILLYGPQYIPAVSLLETLSLGAVSLLLAAGLPSMLMAAHYERQALICYLTAMVLNIALNLIAIPVWGEKAAAWTTVISETAVLVSGIILVHRNLGVSMPSARKLLAQFLPATCVLGGGLAIRAALLSLSITQSLRISLIAGTSLVLWGMSIMWLAQRQK
jgi:O-antigen/teichoic acid export membrane protein